MYIELLGFDINGYYTAIGCNSFLPKRYYYDS